MCISCVNFLNVLKLFLIAAHRLLSVRYPFLTKIEEWNKDPKKTGDTLVEKCCHFFDLFRLITQQEMNSCVSKVHRGLLWDHYGYQDREDQDNIVPIIDSAYVLLDFMPSDANNGPIAINSSVQKRLVQQSTIGCLELCMFAEGSRHQEEIIVTGMKGRVEGMSCMICSGYLFRINNSTC